MNVSLSIRTKIVNNSRLLVLLAAIIYSFYPIFSAHVIFDLSPFFMIAQIYIFYALFNFVPLLFYSIARKQIIAEKNKIILDWESFLAAAIDAASHFFFFLSLGYGSAVIASSVFETWPFFAMLTSYLFMGGQHKFPGTIKIAVSLMAVAGVCILTLQPFEQIEGSITSEYQIVILALIASFFGAIASNYHNRIAILYDVKDSIERYFVMQFFRSVHFLFISVLAIFLGLLFHTPPNLEQLSSVLPFTLLIGGVVFFVVPILFRFGIIYSKDETVYLIWYISPVLTVLLLWFFGLDEYSTSKAVGSILIIVSNIILVGIR